MKRNKNNKPSLYGFHACRAAWLNPERIVEKLYITEQAKRGFEKTFLEAHHHGVRRPDPTIVDKRKLEKLLPKGAVHQGIALSCNPLGELDVHDLIIKVHPKKRARIAMLDQVTDPHNVGAILRSASAFGIDGMVMQRKHSPELSGVLAKTACGGLEHVPVAHATNLSREIESFQRAGFTVFGMDERGESFSKDMISGKTLLVLGSEGSGLRPLVKQHCDKLFSLPTQGQISSLNVSNAAAVAFFATMDG